MAFLEDPRLRQRWNQISHNAEAVTENAAAGIWTFQHAYVAPCLGSLCDAVDACTSVCLGDREERARRQRERARGARRTTRAEYSFDFYDDWYNEWEEEEEEELAQAQAQARAEAAGGDGGGENDSLGTRVRGFFFHTWAGRRSEDWDRLLAGSGARRRGRYDDDSGADEEEAGGSSASTRAAHAIIDRQPKLRSMSYGTRGDQDPTIIPSTAPLGFLGRLPFKIGGPLRYKPSAANLREHPGGSGGSGGGGGGSGSGRRRGAGGQGTEDERRPLLATEDDDDLHALDAHLDFDTHPETRETREASAHAGLYTDAAHAAAYPTTAPATTSPPPGGTYTGTRARSSTAGSGDTSDSFRSRGDLFPSDEEGDEDAVPLDDEFAVEFGRGDDRSSARTRFSSSSSLAGAAAASIVSGGGGGGRRKGKRRADTVTSARSALSRSVSYTTMAESSPPASVSVLSLPAGSPPTSEQQQQQHYHPPVTISEQLQQEEAAEEQEQAQAASLPGHHGHDYHDKEDEAKEAETTVHVTAHVEQKDAAQMDSSSHEKSSTHEFIPARLPRFG